MKNLPLITAISLLLSFTANAQTFCLAVGGTNTDKAYSLVQTSDGGYAIAGQTFSFGAGGNDFYIVKLDSTGAVQWTRTVGGTAGDYAYSIVQTSDGGYAIAGRTSSYGPGGVACYFVKLDSTGTLQWTRTVGGTGFDWFSSLVHTSDSGYAIAGWTNSFGAGGTDFHIVKLDSTGALQWTRTVGGISNDQANSIVQTSDGGYAIAGYTYSFGAGNRDFYIVKLDSTGVVQWTRTVGGTADGYALSIVQTSDGGYAIAGQTVSFGAGGPDFYIVKLDGTGALQWTRTMGGTNADVAYSLVQTTDGGYAITGYTNSFGAGVSDCYIVKLDSTGAVQWTRTVGGVNEDVGASIVQTSGGGYAIAGRTASFGAGIFDYYIVKLDSSGNTCCSSGSGGISGTGGVSGSGGTSGTGGVSGSGGTSSSGGILTDQCVPPVASFSASATSICENDCINFSDQSAGTPTSWSWQFQGGSPASSTLQNPSNICYPTAGTYDVQLIVTNGVGSDTLYLPNYITVNVCGGLVASFSASDTSICEDDCINFFDLSAGNPTNWSWQFQGGTPASFNVQNPTNICYPTAGTYDVLLIVTNGFGFDTLFLPGYITVNVCGGIAALAGDPRLSIYPNPNDGSFTLQGRYALPAVLEIYDITGRKIKQLTINKEQLTIDVSDLTGGLYFVKLVGKEGIFTKKLIIE